MSAWFLQLSAHWTLLALTPFDRLVRFRCFAFVARCENYSITTRWIEADIFHASVSHWTRSDRRTRHNTHTRAFSSRKMRLLASAIATFTLLATTLATADYRTSATSLPAAAAALDRQAQQPLLFSTPSPSPSPSTSARCTRTTTIRTTRTRTRTVYADALTTSTALPEESPTRESVKGESVRVQTWYGGQKRSGCDRTACASCRVWYQCRGGEPAW